MGLQSSFEIVHNGQNSPDAFGVGIFHDIRLFALGAPAEVVEFRLAAQQAVQQLVVLLDQAVAIGGYRFQSRGRSSAVRRIRGSGAVTSVDSSVLVHRSSVYSSSV